MPSCQAIFHNKKNYPSHICLIINTPRDTDSALAQNSGLNFKSEKFLMPRKEKIFDDMARVAGGAAGVFSGLSSNIRKEIKSCVDDVITRLDLVPREDFDRAMEMLSEYRIQQENLKTRIEKLEKNSKPSATKKGTKS